jgi:hypothetical protein
VQPISYRIQGDFVMARFADHCVADPVSTLRQFARQAWMAAERLTDHDIDASRLLSRHVVPAYANDFMASPGPNDETPTKRYLVGVLSDRVFWRLRLPGGDNDPEDGDGLAA